MMTGADRAKQFMSFSALKGFETAVKVQENIREERVYLAEDAQQELNLKLHTLEHGDIVTAEYYRGGCYVLVRGAVKKIDMNARRLILGETRIPIDDLKDIYREA